VKDPDLIELVDALRAYLGPRLRDSPEARRLARAVGAWLTRAADEAGVGDAELGHGSPLTAPVAEATVDRPEPRTEPLAGEPEEPKGRGIVPLNIGGAVTHVEVSGDTDAIGRARLAGGAMAPEPTDPTGAPAEIDLHLIETRARLKARSCLHFIDLRDARYDHERERPLLEQMHGMIAEAKSLRGCFLWVFMQDKAQPDDETLRWIAGSYDAMTDATELMRVIDEAHGAVGRDRVAEAMALLAEASSALRVGLESSWLTAPDTDQEESHHWLRHETKLRQVFIERHMKLDDPADPVRHADLRRRIAALRQRCESELRSASEIEELFKRIGYHAGKVGADTPRPDPHDTARIVGSIERLAERGVPTSDPRFEAAIPEGVAEVIVACDSRTAVETVSHILMRRAQATAPEPEAPTRRRWSEQVLQVRPLLKGRRVVIIGGEPRPDAIARIEDAFELERAEWPALVEHGPGTPMRAPIERAETACVLVLIKLCGHLHAEEAAACAKAAGIPCVNLTAGYNPEQIADAVLRQASEKLSLVTTGAGNGA